VSLVLQAGSIPALTPGGAGQGLFIAPLLPTGYRESCTTYVRSKKGD